MMCPAIALVDERRGLDPEERSAVYRMNWSTRKKANWSNLSAMWPTRLALRAQKRTGHGYFACQARRGI